MSNSILAGPSPWVKKFTSLIPAGEVLDLACGGGRNSRFLLAEGFTVTCLDRDDSSFADLASRGAKTILHDLEPDAEECDLPFPPACFAAIVVCNYLHRPLFPRLLESLQQGGLLIYETFAMGNEQFGKPSSPRFLLQTGELLRQVHANPESCMHVIAYEEGFIAEPKPAMVQRICARKAVESTPEDKLSF
jgi:SAM-dependent methyltransferase